MDYHAPPLMGWSRQENWSGLPFPSPDLKAKRCIFTCLKDFSVNAGDRRDMGWISVLERSPGGGESHGQRSLVGYNAWDHKESDTTELT